jgi:hypothetical protein
MYNSGAKYPLYSVRIPVAATYARPVQHPCGSYEIVLAIGAGGMGREPLFAGESDGNRNGCFRLP